MDTVQWPQEIVVKPLEEIVINTTASSCPKPNLLSSSPSAAALDQRKQRPEKDQALNCPRCNSTNTKFCYYNNYSLTQPRYFCKACRRYWTAGGSLRNIPVGGGSRKNKRSASNSSSSSKSLKLPDLVTHQNPKIEVADHQGNVSGCRDLNLGFPATHQISALELITGVSSRGLNSFMPMSSCQDPNGIFGSGYNPMHELNLKPLSFAMDGLGSGFSGLEEGNGSVLFPFEDLNQVSTSTSNNSDVDQQSNKQGRDSSPPGYWTGILGGSW